jgi:hypothetical protein
MRSLAIVVGLPAASIVIVSLYAAGGIGRWVAMGLLAVSLTGIVSVLGLGKSRSRKGF